jgi:hypothetical protein
MPYKISEIHIEHFPDEKSLVEAFNSFGLIIEELHAALKGFVCEATIVRGHGYQQSLDRELKSYLKKVLLSNGSREIKSPNYSPSLNRKADLALGMAGSNHNIYFEIEFRPSVEKDLINFQIGYNCGRLAAGVLILANDRNSINSSYQSMPEFRNFVQVIKEFRPSYPLLVIGFSGKHIHDSE